MNKLAQLMLSHAKKLGMNTKDPAVNEHLRKVTEQIIRTTPHLNDDKRAEVIGLMLPKHAPVKLADGGQVEKTFDPTQPLNAPQQGGGAQYQTSQPNRFAKGGEVKDPPDVDAAANLDDSNRPIVGQHDALQQSQDAAREYQASQTPEAMAAAQQGQNVPLAMAAGASYWPGGNPESAESALANLGPNQLKQQQNYGNNSLNELNNTNADVSSTQGNNIGNAIEGENSLLVNPSSNFSKEQQRYAETNGVPVSTAEGLSGAGLGQTTIGKQIGQTAEAEGKARAAARTTGQYDINNINTRISEINAVQDALTRSEKAIPGDVFQSILGGKISDVAAYLKAHPEQSQDINTISRYVQNHKELAANGVVDPNSLRTQLNIKKNNLSRAAGITTEFGSQSVGHFAEGGEIEKVTVIPDIPDDKLHEFAKHVLESGRDPVECAHEMFGDKAAHVMEHIHHFADGGEVTPFGDSGVSGEELNEAMKGQDDSQQTKSNDGTSSHDGGGLLHDLGVTGEALLAEHAPGLAKKAWNGLKLVGGKLVRAAPAALEGAEEGAGAGEVADPLGGGIPGAVIGGAIGLGTALLSGDSDKSEESPQDQNVTSQTSPLDRIQQDHDEPNPDISPGLGVKSPFLNARNKPKIDPSVLSGVSDAEQSKGLPQGLGHAIAQTESNYNPSAINRNKNGTYDSGVFQINSTNIPRGMTQDQILDPKTNIDMGTTMLSKLIAKNNGDIPRAIYEYNHGSSHLISDQRVKNDPYVRRVLSNWPQRNNYS